VREHPALDPQQHPPITKGITMNKIHRNVAAALAAALLAVGASACGGNADAKDGKADSPKPAATTSAAPTPTPTETPTPTTEPTPTDTGVVIEEGGSAEQLKASGAVPLGQQVTVGDWQITVTKVVLNADGLVNQWNSYNDKPKKQYLAVYFDATYTGAKRMGDSWDLYWSLSTTDGVVHDYSEQWDVSDEEDWPTETRTGGTINDVALFDVPADKVSGGFLSVEDYESDQYVDFQL